MANYESKTRSNYFRVTDTAKFKELMKSVALGDDMGCDDTKCLCEEETGKCCVAGYGSLYCITPDGEEDDIEYESGDAFYKELSHIIVPDDAAIFTEIGNEKLRYLVATAVIVTKDNVEYISLQDLAIKQAKSLLNDQDWTTDMSY